MAGESKVELMLMGSSSIVGGGLCVKQDGYVITIFREGPDGPVHCKVKKMDRRSPKL